MKRIGRLNIPKHYSQDFEDRMIAGFSAHKPIYAAQAYLQAAFVFYMTFGPNDCQWMIPGTQRESKPMLPITIDDNGKPTY